MMRRRWRGHDGMTLIELCVVIAILGVLLVLAVTSLKRARLAANETSAKGTLRTITKGQFAYAVGCGRGYYATSLVILGAKPPGVVQAWLPDDLTSGPNITRDGYTMSMHPGKDAVPNINDCMGNQTQTAYYAYAVPLELGATGRSAYATNQGAAIWSRRGNTPPTEPFGPPDEPAE